MLMISLGCSCRRVKLVWVTTEVSRWPCAVPSLADGMGAALATLSADCERAEDSADGSGAAGAAAAGDAGSSRRRPRPWPLSRRWLWGSGVMAGAGWGTGGCSRNSATPITPTCAGRPVRAAYELAMWENSKAATWLSLLRQPVIW